MQVQAMMNSVQGVNRYFIHYYDSGRIQYSEKAGTRIAREARSFKQPGTEEPFFKEVLTYTKANLSESYLKAHEQQFKHERGAGYWVWKGEIIRMTMEKYMQEGDELVYSDSGSELTSDFPMIFDLID